MRYSQIRTTDECVSDDLRILSLTLHGMHACAREKEKERNTEEGSNQDTKFSGSPGITHITVTILRVPIKISLKHQEEESGMSE